MEEIGILNMLDHPNIVSYRETYDDKNYVYISKLHNPIESFIFLTILYAASSINNALTLLL